ncbi:sigma-54 interaction domain-containing protein [Brevibacillus massiliensis]|jgi:transcriptional regulator with PAS, ATPase and Fis domain|uniref:sigma-54 interaction domain-containing protein n=1 Tax=Brevibacillus massiliensis TaxID=1118054 RepID=UPI0002F2445E|nr:sigma 54-interacting transcriptional regulator [Brevibacillus massiliensis]
MFLSTHAHHPPAHLTSKNARFSHTLAMIRRVAVHPCTVLIEGETGVGKEVIATLIHEESPRAGMPFIRLNCGAIPDALAESELFGYEGGAFTGAKKEGSPGMFEQADKGTILLDEISELSPLMQVKLLRALQEREIRRVGGSWSKTIDVRVIACTNRNLSRLVEEGKFREDLFYRLQVVHFVIPPLRERPEDLPDFLEGFSAQFAAAYGTGIKSFSPEAREALLHYSWPGNIRQLRNCLEGLYATVEGELIRLSDLPPYLQQSGIRTEGRRSSAGLRQQLDQFEKQVIEEALKQSKSIRQAAAMLRLPHATLLRRMEKLGIEKTP